MKSKEFTVQVKETLLREVKITAETPEEAIHKVRMDYIAEKIVLDETDFNWIDITIVEQLWN